MELIAMMAILLLFATGYIVAIKKTSRPPDKKMRLRLITCLGTNRLLGSPPASPLYAFDIFCQQNQAPTVGYSAPAAEFQPQNRSVIINPPIRNP